MRRKGINPVNKGSEPLTSPGGLIVVDTMKCHALDAIILIKKAASQSRFVDEKEKKRMEEDFFYVTFFCYCRFC